MPNGIQVAQQGIQVGRAADYQKVLDSRWKFLEVVFDDYILINKTNLLASNQGATTGGTLGYNIYTIANHNLGYLPYIEYYFKQPYSDSNSDYFAGLQGQPIWADENNVYFQIVYYRYTNAAPDTYNRLFQMDLVLRVYAVDITQEYRSSTINPASTITSAPNPVGVKISSGKRPASSGDVRDLTINTQAKSLAILQTGIVTATSDSTPVITHNAGYPPSFMVSQLNVTTGPAYNRFITDANNPFYNKRVITDGQGSLYRASVTNQTLTLNGGQGALLGVYPYIILRDPSELAQ